MRGFLVCLVAAATIVASTAIASTAAAPNPCGLVTAADVEAVLGAAVGPGKLQSLGLYKSCTYRATGFFVTVQTRAMSRADFVKSAKLNPAPVRAVRGLGVPAFYVGRASLLVWKSGSEATFTIFSAGPQYTHEVALAKRALRRL